MTDERTTDTSASEAGQSEGLPQGYRLVRELSRRPSVRVIEALRGSQRLVLRLEYSSSAGSAELAVLASAEHPGLAHLIDHGALPGGGRYLAREWIEGTDLSELAPHRSPTELGLIVARLCPALEYLHDRGFVHADLKAANVIVREGDQPVLTDFDLSRSQGEASARGASGTGFSIAPEVLVGRPPEPASDLFALGVLLFGLLIDAHRDAQSFYGHFPAAPFFEAIGADPAQLPEWSRDLIAQLVERDPRKRPRSAAIAGRMLEGRLGATKSAASTCRPRLEWPPLQSREAWLQERANEESFASWWNAPESEDPRPFLQATRLRRALEGAPVQWIDLERGLAQVSNSRALDRWADRTLEANAGSQLFLGNVHDDRWHLRAIEYLLRAAEQRRSNDPQRAPASILACVPAGLEPPPGSWSVHAVPPVSEEEIVEFLGEEFEDEVERLDELAARMHAESGGSSSVLAELCQDLAASGQAQFGREKLRLRPGPLPSWLGRTRRSSARTSPAQFHPDSKRLLASLAVLGGRAELGRAVALAGIESTSAARIDELTREGRLAVERDAQGAMWLGLLRWGQTLPQLDLDEAAWRAMHMAQAQNLEGEGSDRRLILPHLYRAFEEVVLIDEIVDELEGLREQGCAELALDLVQKIVSEARSAKRELEPRLIGQHALTWAVLGDAERAVEVAAPLADLHDDAPSRALFERVQGQVATLRHRYDEALEHYERALGLGGAIEEALQGKAVVLFESGKDAELEELVAQADAGKFGQLPRRLDVNLHGFAALSAFRRGHVDRARTTLESALEEAQRIDDPLREAVLCINLGTVERRTGRLTSAIGHFERARQLYEESGFLPGVTQALTLLGGVEREAGELLEAEPHLTAALESRERSGDTAGAAAVRGILGLLFAERGRLRAALEELTRSSEEVGAAGRAVDAALLAARANEVRARLGQDPEAPVADERELAKRDPRILVARARATLLQGRRHPAEASARLAYEIAQKLARKAPEEEADFLLHLIEGDTDMRTDTQASKREYTQPSVGADAELFAMLERRNGDFPTREAMAFAKELARRGRDDRAARLFLAVAARSGDAALRSDASGRAERCLADCSLGLTPEESGAMRSNLLGVPDPWPKDLEQGSALLEGEATEVLSLLDINHRLVEQEDLPTLLGTIVESALEVTHAERGMLVLEEQGELSLDLAKDSVRGDIDEAEVDYSTSIIRRTLEAGRPVRLSNAADDPVIGKAPSVISLDLRSILCHPFEVHDGLRGVIYLDNRVREGVFTERAEKLLSLLADQAALAIRQVRRLEEIRRLNSELNREVVVKETDLRAARRALVDAGVTAPVGGLVGSSAPMQRIHQLLHRIAPHNLPVLVCGKSGTGKELAARALHDLSERSEKPFVSESCAALPDSLIESELFGYTKGAFTGADSDRAGIFEQADGGTLFLDEIGELPIDLQAKLLRVLETREVRRLGDNKLRPVDFRLVAATNRNLEQSVKQGEFREDLYYRLDAVRIEMPPLAERSEDIPALVDHFLRLEETKSSVTRQCAPAVLKKLSEREWPGNVRELGNELARLCVLSEGDITDPELVRSARADVGSGPQQVQPLAEVERAAIMRALDQTDGDKRRAAELLGISRAKIYQRLKEWREAEGRS